MKELPKLTDDDVTTFFESKPSKYVPINHEQPTKVVQYTVHRGLAQPFRPQQENRPYVRPTTTRIQQTQQIVSNGRVYYLKPATMNNKVDFNDTPPVLPLQTKN
uniref:Uncharacterized protein n=1 Tax=Panagrolaimus sp. JU765 TaxID=591449 RepID=A0AC34QIT2_9BILA